MSINFATLKGLTIPVPQTVVPETTETSTIMSGDFAGFIASYVVTVDGVEYHCETYNNEYGELALGDSRVGDSQDLSNPVDMPFYVVSSLTADWTTGKEVWVIDVMYPDSNTHTIEIKEMIDASVTQITDASGRVIWAVQSNKPVVLEVEKITADTYAGETTYTGEEFILLNIYPKTNGIVNVTYGGLTKTVTDTSGAETPNAQQVFFGTFNGVSDSVTTPASGTLIIDGGYYGGAFAVGTYTLKGSKYNSTAYFGGIKSVNDFGSIKGIADRAFYGNKGLTSITIPKSVTSIGEQAFTMCSQLASASFEGATIIGSSSFSLCSALKSIVLSGVTDVGYNAFSSSGLTSVTITPSVKNIEGRAFNGCSSINFIVDSGNQYYSSEGSILFNKAKTLLHSHPTVSGHYTIPSSVTHIGDYAFDFAEALTSITIPASVTHIGKDAFFNCTGLTTVTIPSAVIGNGAFAACYNLTSVTLENGVTSISSNAFSECELLSTITIPASVTYIGGSAFSATTIDNVILLATTPPELGGMVFEEEYGLPTITVPKGCGATYKAASGWSEYADYIVEAS